MSRWTGCQCASSRPLTTCPQPAAALVAAGLVRAQRLDEEGGTGQPGAFVRRDGCGQCLSERPATDDVIM